MNLHEHVLEWENLWLAYQKASRGKRCLAPAAEFEFDLADNLLELQKELSEKCYQPGVSQFLHPRTKKTVDLCRAVP